MAFNKEAIYYDIFHQDKNYKEEALFIKQKFPNAKTVLEIGCGTGNLTIELEKLGFDVTCIEPSVEMLKYFKGRTSKVVRLTIQDYNPPNEKFDLVLAMYDMLNYIPKSEFDDVIIKMVSIGKFCHFETWSKFKPIRPIMYKCVNNCHRLRLGFKVKDVVHLWFIFWGRGLVISKHKLYL